MSTIKITLSIDVNSDDELVHRKIKQWVRENTHHIDRYAFESEDEEGEEITASIDDIELEVA